jgi:serine/threonine protein phosphatase 1
VPAGTRVYAIGDVHGRADLLAEMHGLIRADADGATSSRRLIVYLGDYVDRGHDSAGVIEALLAGPEPGFEAVHLIGNHEQAMLDFLDDVAIGPMWLYNGGGATLASYGVRAPHVASPRELEPVRRLLLERLPARHRAFLAGLRLWHAEGDYLFVHAGVRPGVALEAQSREDLLWIREEFLYSNRDFGHIVVHGHTIFDQPQLRPNRIGIDTGAFHTGTLTCLVLEGADRRFLQT